MLDFSVPPDLLAFTDAYQAGLLAVATDPAASGTCLALRFGVHDLHWRTEETVRLEALDFWTCSHGRLLEAFAGGHYTPEMAGRDLAAARNGGPGFLARGLDVVGPALQAAAVAMGPCQLYPREDDQLYLHGHELDIDQALPPIRPELEALVPRGL